MCADKDEDDDYEMDERDKIYLKRLGYSKKKHLIDYCKIVKKDCNPKDSVRYIYETFFHKPFYEIENRYLRDGIDYCKLKTKILFLDFDVIRIRELKMDEYFYYNKKVIFYENEIKIKEGVLIFNVRIIDACYELTEVKHFSWIKPEGNYFRIKKEEDNGKYYIIYDKFSATPDPVRRTKRRTRREIEEEEYQKSMENISKTLKQMSEDKKQHEFKKENFREGNDKDVRPAKKFIVNLDRIKDL